MDDPTVKKIVDFLSTELEPLVYRDGDKHVLHGDTSEPIPYDLHMPNWLLPTQLEYDPNLWSGISEHFIDTLAQQESVVDPSNVDRIDAFIRQASFDIRHIVPREAIAETCVKHVQSGIHKIASPFASLASFGVDDSEIGEFRVFAACDSSGEVETKTDILVQCEPREGAKPEQWGPLWSSITEPRDLRHPHFRVLHTEEHKNILAGNPRMILGIYIIAWCLANKYLKSFWPANDCDNCVQFTKSHKAEEVLAKADSDKTEYETPLDSDDATAPSTTNLADLEQEIDRVIVSVDAYDKNCNVSTSTKGNQTGKKRKHPHGKGKRPVKRKSRQAAALEVETDISTPEELKSFDETLEDATDRAIKDLNLAPGIRAGLHKWVLRAAYILIQVSASASQSFNC
ncbi:hypothetical protein C8R47DRAFT_1138586 [Mycena vitilis]|nr:hypothetical protein C8R47DRAFT_1138586 [Mycena vitilis]